MSVLNREATINFLVQNCIIDTVEADYESRASVTRFNMTTNNNTGGVLHSIRYASLRVTKSLLVWMYKNTNQYCVRAYISSLYSLGIGLPKNADAAKFWKIESYGRLESETKCCLYSVYKQQLKTDIKGALTNNIYLYTQDVKKQYKLLELLPVKEGHIKCVILYKRSYDSYKFHNMLLDSDNFVFDITPRMIGAKASYTEFYPNVKYIVSLGYICEGDNYTYKIPPAKIVRKIASTFCEAKDVSKFTKSVKYIHNDVVLINFEGKVKKYAQPSVQVNYN